MYLKLYASQIHKLTPNTNPTLGESTTEKKKEGGYILTKQQKTCNYTLRALLEG